MRIANAIFAAGCVLGVGCSSLTSETEDRPLPAAVAPPVRPGVAALSPANGRIEFTGSQGPISQTGRFESFSGQLEAPTDDPVDAKIHVRVDVGSVATKYALLTKHLKGEDFFDVQKHPTAEFTSSRIEATPSPGEYRVSGRFSFHGVQRDVSFPAKVRMEGNEAVVSAVLKIVAADYNIAKGSGEVPIRIQFRGRRK